MSSNVDMSLEDIISKNNVSRPNSGRMRGRGRGGRGGTNYGNRYSGQRDQRPFSGFRTFNRGVGGVRSISTGSTKLNISNLDGGVLDSDIRGLFSELGDLRSAAVHYDKIGRSLKTAHVVFDRREDAMKALRQYNGVHLDGKPMMITLDASIGSAEGARTLRVGQSFGPGRNVRRLQGGLRGGGQGRGRGGGSFGRRTAQGTRGGRRGDQSGDGDFRKKSSADELDKELDDYTSKSSKRVTDQLNKELDAYASEAKE